eukprot:m.224897 g.224897  ORF g.224897 m.224897 type:complete len:56 (+) comp13855_c2_seq7:215-382(+)
MNIASSLLGKVGKKVNRFQSRVRRTSSTTLQWITSSLQKDKPIFINVYSPINDIG